MTSERVQRSTNVESDELIEKVALLRHWDEQSHVNAGN